ncbi:MAG: conjugal transfer protein TraX, partial [Clostridia bacterium]|nr:conjugal transfer protein TraX [Clostridia bacterium]
MKKTLTASFLKWTALVSMTVDHIGIIFRPLLSPLLYQTLRSVGRLSFPLFGFLLAEGYRFTRDRKRYGFRILFLGLLIQIVYTVFTGSFFLNILLTFSLSFPLLYFFRRGTEKPAFQVAAVLYLLLLWV